jgi:predicted transcriptional regulator
MTSQSSLPDAELEIMQIVWQFEPPVARSAIEKKLSEQKHLAPSTILTYLTRLCDRGFLRVEQQGRKNLYTPLVTKKDYLSGESRRMLDRLFGGSLSELAVSLCDSGIKKEEIDALRTMLEKGSL